MCSYVSIRFVQRSPDKTLHLIYLVLIGFIFTGWIAVQVKDRIDVNLYNTPFEILENTLQRQRNKYTQLNLISPISDTESLNSKLRFSKRDDENNINFELIGCSKNTVIPTVILAENTANIWTMRLTGDSFTLYRNDTLVMEVPTKEHPGSRCHEVMRDQENIRFVGPHDVTSDYYRIKPRSKLINFPNPSSLDLIPVPI